MRAVRLVTAKAPAGLSVEASDGNGHVLAPLAVAEPHADALLYDQADLHRW